MIQLLEITTAPQSLKGNVGVIRRQLDCIPEPTRETKAHKIEGGNKNSGLIFLMMKITGRIIFKTF